MFRRFQVRRPINRSERGFENWAALRRLQQGLNAVRQLISPRPNPPRPNPPSPQNNSPSPQNNSPSPQNNSPSPQNNTPSPTISDISDLSDVSDVSDSNEENDDSIEESEQNENEESDDSNESNSDSSHSDSSHSDSNEDEEDDEDDEDGEDGENEAKLSDDEEDEDGGDEDGGDGENVSDEDEDEAKLPDEIRRTKTNGVTITLRRYKDLDIYISRDGNYRSTHNINRLFPASNCVNDGLYPAYNYGETRIQVNHMVASCWVPNPNDWYFVNHKDGNYQNCHFRNLEWIRLRYHRNPTYGYAIHTSVGRNGRVYRYKRFIIHKPNFNVNFKTASQRDLFRQRAEPIMNQYNQDGNATTFKQSMKQLATQIKSGH